jgi:hypothetical protein
VSRPRTATAAVLAQTALVAGMPDWQIEQFLADLVGARPDARGLDRRAFLKVLGLGTAGVAAALWVPGQKTIFVPPEKSVVVASVSDLKALRAAFPGPFMLQQHAGQMFGRFLDPTQALQVLSDQEYALVIARGKRILAGKGLRG